MIMLGKFKMKKIIASLKRPLHDIEENINSSLIEVNCDKNVKIGYKNDKLYPNGRTFSSLFEEQAEKTPDNIAIIYGNHSLSYKQVNESANQLANYMKDTYVIKPDDLIILCLNRSEWMLIAILAVWKAGAAYVPVDSNYPEDRLAYILEDTKTRIALTNENFKNKLINLSSKIPAEKAKSKISIVAIDSNEFQEIISKQPAHNPASDATSRNLAYVIYTSGTTGKPKGVMIEHKSVVDRLVNLKDKHCITNELIFGAKTSYIFEPSIREMFLPLLAGARVVIFSESTYRDVNKIFDVCIKEKINIIIFVPSHLSIFIDSLRDISANLLGDLDLKMIYSCGEPLSKKLATDIFKYLPNVIVKNQYGPTEGCQVLFEQELTLNNINEFEKIPVESL
jgi:non-ribosomal peptide synthetase component F